MTPTDQNEIIKIIFNLQSLKSCGYDNLSSDFIKRIKHAISFPLCHLINNSLSCGKFASDLKIAKVILIFKSGDKEKVGNYTSIPLLPIFSKVFEKVVHKRLLIS